MLDCYSGGRIISGFVAAGPSKPFKQVLTHQNRERFEEAHDLIVKCWTEPGPSDTKGNTTSTEW
ncbi:MAG: hypothetical protein Ct9H300mP11_07000 [Chloroflexota bacterium]|nr:MAG: hypothetical protein Ct9H300mP11_07000 [Chloroflexota bacterium]